MPVESSITSPRDLLASLPQIREALLLTYTSNLAFFERFALQEVRSRGALVTLVADATAAYVDPTVIRSAGRLYLDGRAACRAGGRFHPKLIVLAGDEEIVAAIGSGNVTMPGWHQNAELWTVLQGDEDGIPTALGDLAGWLRGLSAAVRLSPGVEPAIARVADLITRFPDSGSGPRLVTTLTGSIIDQLPQLDALDELTVSAPFFDPDAAALIRLCQRLQASQVTVALQPDQASFDGVTLADAAQQLGATLTAITDTRYHHGKVIEWRAGERYTALTGSPNVSVAALIRPMAQGGNCELALLCDQDHSLAPASAQPIAAADVQDHTYQPLAEALETMPALLAAVIDQEGTTVYLARELTEPGVIEAFQDDRWQPQAEAPPDLSEITCGLLGAAVPIRVRVGEQVSSVVLTCDLAAVLRRRITHKGRVRTDPDAMFRDLGIPDQFLKDLEELRPYLPPSTRTPAAAKPHSTPDDKPRRPAQGWEDYLEACAAQIGDPMLSFALGLPQLFGNPSIEVAPPDGPGGLTTDTDHEAAAEELQAPTVRNFQLTASERERQRVRRFCTRLAELAPRLAPMGQLIALRLLLRLIAGKLWGEPSRSAAVWVPLLRRTMLAAAATDPQFDAVGQARASLVALGLAVLRGQVKSRSPYTFDAFRAVYEETQAEVAAVIADVTDDQVDLYSAELLEGLGQTLRASTVMALVAQAGTTRDLLDEAVDIARDEMGLEMSRDGRLLRIETQLSRPLIRALLRAVRVVEDEGPVALEGETNQEWGLIAWNRPKLVFIQRTAGHTRGALYSMSWPGTHADGAIPDPRARWTGTTPPAEAAELLAQVGISL